MRLFHSTFEGLLLEFYEFPKISIVRKFRSFENFDLLKLTKLRRFVGSNIFKKFVDQRLSFGQINMKDTIVCKDSRHLGKSLEILDSIDLRCSQPKFAITDGARGPVISWNGTFDREEPPFSKYMLYYSKVMNIGKFHS